MMLRRWGLAASGWLALAATVPPAGTPLRVFVTAVFLLVCPGLAAVQSLRPAARRSRDPAELLEAAVLSVVVSLSLSVLVAEALFLSGTFTARRALLALAVLTSLLALVPRPGSKRSKERPVTAESTEPEG
ncbi:DUF1616 domain-containing protein [Streptomyces lunaelactis]|uniref:DUF1616 domain-containing protein n=1 Tax=Streptomyces lunaelactis TaxID=1535768 RepID=UPI001584AB78|nr:DUF1616 domain-containing protein [Streptomyces lunaelactis]NUK05616.1 hypothetical protein [Streptomyces lunaelactis]NUK19874.1 hypothetical protein [Streptomyces lunaelactis]